MTAGGAGFSASVSVSSAVDFSEDERWRAGTEEVVATRRAARRDDERAEKALAVLHRHGLSKVRQIMSGVCAVFGGGGESR